MYHLRLTISCLSSLWNGLVEGLFVDWSNKAEASTLTTIVQIGLKWVSSAVTYCACFSWASEMFHSLLYPAWTLHPFGSSLLRVRFVVKILNSESGHCRDGIGWKSRVKFVSSRWSVLVCTLISMVLANAPCSPICNVPSSWKVSALC